MRYRRVIEPASNVKGGFFLSKLNHGRSAEGVDCHGRIKKNQRRVPIYDSLFRYFCQNYMESPKFMLRVYIAILFFFISIVGHSQSTPQEFIDKAYELSSAGKIGEAVSLYNIAIAKFPDEPIFYTLKGGLMVQHIDYFATDDSLYNSALNLFDKALELDSGFVPAHNSGFIEV